MEVKRKKTETIYYWDGAKGGTTMVTFKKENGQIHEALETGVKIKDAEKSWTKLENRLIIDHN